MRVEDSAVETELILCVASCRELIFCEAIEARETVAKPEMGGITGDTTDEGVD